MATVRRSTINLLPLKVGEMVELKQNQFLLNLRYIGKALIQPYRSNISWWKYRYSIGGREFSIDDDSLHDLLLNNRKHIDTLILEAHEWHPILTDKNGNILFDDYDETIPALNMEVTQKTFFFVLAIKTDEVAYYKTIAGADMIAKAKVEQAKKEEDRQHVIEKSNQWKGMDDEFSYEPSQHSEEFPDAYERSDDELNGDFDNQ